MGAVWSAIASNLSSASLLFLLPIPILYALWNWVTRNQVERLFLSKNTTNIIRIAEATFWFLIFNVAALLLVNLLPVSLDSLSTHRTFPTILYVLYVLLFTLFLFESSPQFEELKDKGYFNGRFWDWISKLFKDNFFINTALVLTTVLVMLVYRHFINISLATYEPLVRNNSSNSDVNSTKDILSFLLGAGFDDYSYRVFAVLFIFSLFFYALIAFPFRFMARRLLIEEFERREVKVTIVLKNGKKFEDVYLQNSSSGKFIHFHNKSRLATQYLVIPKDDIESFLFSTDKHKDEDSMKQE